MTSSTPSPPEPAPLGSVLVTGGCGFLGSHILGQLVKRSKPGTNSIAVLDVREPRVSVAGVSYFAADITSVVSLRVILEQVKPDVVIHTVSPVYEEGGGKKAREKMKHVNVEGTRILMEECKKAGTRVFIYTSSSSVISDARTDVINADERYSLLMGKHQPEYYSGTKAEAEELVLAANTRQPASQPFLTIALRPAGMFGEYDVQMIPRMLDVVRRGQTRFQFGDNENLYDFTYVGNVAFAHILSAVCLLDVAKQLASGAMPVEPDEPADQKPEHGTRIDGEAFLITNTQPIYFWDFPRAVWQAYYRFASTPEAAQARGKQCSPPAPPKSTISISHGVGMALATFLVWITWLLRLPAPRLQPLNVKFSTMTRYFRTRKAQRRLGYAPVWTIDEGIDRTVEWFWQRELDELTKKDR